MTQEKDLHIRVLQFVMNNPRCTFKQLREEFPQDIDFLKREIIHSNIFQSPEETLSIDDRSTYVLSFDDRFKLLNYEELQEARHSSRNAHCIAVISIIATFIAILVDIFFN
jgi:hypothetical protein